jgi:hypothetical protein
MPVSWSGMAASTVTRKRSTSGSGTPMARFAASAAVMRALRLAPWKVVAGTPAKIASG